MPPLLRLLLSLLRLHYLLPQQIIPQSESSAAD
jgi:hypothetical protein